MYRAQVLVHVRSQSVYGARSIAEKRIYDGKNAYTSCSTAYDLCMMTGGNIEYITCGGDVSWLS